MARNEQGLREALRKIPELRAEFWRDVRVPGDEEDYNQSLERAGRVADFLEFARSRGNDLVTPAPAYGFPGLKPGDRWCLCAARWKEALRAGVERCGSVRDRASHQ